MKIELSEKLRRTCAEVLCITSGGVEYPIFLSGNFLA